MSKSLIIIDAGHGGLNHEGYTTHPHKRHDWGDTQINEGVLNRAIAAGLSFQLDYCKIPNVLLVPEPEDISLGWRVNRVNKLCETHKCFLLSIHHNWHDTPSAKGYEVFVFTNSRVSGAYADIIVKNWNNPYYLYAPRPKPLRRDNPARQYKEANFNILRQTKCPAVLTEYGFMSNSLDATMISSPIGIAAQVYYLTDACKEIYTTLMK